MHLPGDEMRVLGAYLFIVCFFGGCKKDYLFFFLDALSFFFCFFVGEFLLLASDFWGLFRFLVCVSEFWLLPAKQKSHKELSLVLLGQQKTPAVGGPG